MLLPEHNTTAQQLTDSQILHMNSTRHQAQKPAAIPAQFLGTWVGNPIPIYDVEAMSGNRDLPYGSRNKVNFNEDLRTSSKHNSLNSSTVRKVTHASPDFGILEGNGSSDTENHPAKGSGLRKDDKQVSKVDSGRTTPVSGCGAGKATPHHEEISSKTIPAQAMGTNRPSSSDAKELCEPPQMNIQSSRNSDLCSPRKERHQQDHAALTMTFSEGDLSVQPVSSQDHPSAMYEPKGCMDTIRNADTDLNRTSKKQQRDPLRESHSTEIVSSAGAKHPSLGNDIQMIIDKELRGLDFSQGAGAGILLIKPSINIFHGPTYGMNTAGLKIKPANMLKKRRPRSDQIEIINVEDLTLESEEKDPLLQLEDSDFDHSSESVIDIQQQVDKMDLVLSSAREGSATAEISLEEEEDDDGMNEEIKNLSTSELLLKEQLELAHQQLALQERLLHVSVGKSIVIHTDHESNSSSDEIPSPIDLTAISNFSELGIDAKDRKDGQRECNSLTKNISEPKQNSSAHIHQQEVKEKYGEEQSHSQDGNYDYESPIVSALSGEEQSERLSSPDPIQEEKYRRKAEAGIPMALTEFDDFEAPRFHPSIFSCCGPQEASINGIDRQMEQAWNDEGHMEGYDAEDDLSFQSPAWVKNSRIDQILGSMDSVEQRFSSWMSSSLQAEEGKTSSHQGDIVMHHPHCEAVEVMLHDSAQDSDQEEVIEIIFVEDSFLSADAFSFGEAKGIVFNWIKMGEDEHSRSQWETCRKKSPKNTSIKRQSTRHQQSKNLSQRTSSPTQQDGKRSTIQKTSANHEGQKFFSESSPPRTTRRDSPNKCPGRASTVTVKEPTKVQFSTANWNTQTYSAALTDTYWR